MFTPRLRRLSIGAVVFIIGQNNKTLITEQIIDDEVKRDDFDMMM